MDDFKIGVIIDSFRLGIADGIKKAKEVGAQGIQIYATSGEMAPENLSAAQRKELLDRIKSNGLVVSALCGDLGGHGFTVPEENRWKIDKSKRIMELAKDLETSVVTTHIGVVPEEENHPKRQIMWEACNQLASFGDEIGAAFAIETGPEKSAILKSFLDSLTARGVRVNLDPANLVMVSGDDPVEAVRNLAPYIVHTHAKDGVMLRKVSPESVYDPDKQDLFSQEAFREVPLGEGGVHFETYLPALKAAGFNGFLTIEREVGEDPEKDIRMAVRFLKQQMALL